MALDACLREACSAMVRFRGLLEVLEVASHAVLGGPGIFGAHVALRALHGDVRSRQRECCL
jgi:hypothetical protein